MNKIIVFLLSSITAFSLFVGITNPTHAITNVNSFTIENYQIDYYLGNDTENRSTLKTVEKIDVLFPSSDQNRGIERAISKSYDGHSTSLNISLVTDGDGNKLNYTTYTSDGNEIIRIGNANTYVHGLQKYEITYSQKDVTRYFADTKSDEFYWDTNGTEWKVPIKSLSINLHISDNLTDKLNNQKSCYQGISGSSDSCLMQKTDDGYSILANNLSPYENVTIAVGFKPQTFAVYQMTLFEKMLAIWFVILFFSFIPFLIWIIILIIRYIRKSNRKGEHQTIVPEYIPPKNTSVTVSASIYNQQKTVFSAQLIDFAVRHYIKIYQTREKSLFKKAQYEIEIIKNITSLHEEEQEILHDIFPTTAVGIRLKLEEMKKNRIMVAKNMSDNKKKLDLNIRGQYGLRAKNAQQSAWFRRTVLITLIVAIFTFSPLFLAAAILSFVFSFTLCPLTDKGLALFRYLEGLKMYIKVAEVERLKMLQSPEGAEKLDVKIDIKNPKQLVKLYERVLPYAILFGLEKDWNNQLGQYYESINKSPDWYQGSNNQIFNAAVFGAAISGFNSAATYSNPTSSSSGGSGGGGFSGGGGGGGGGGGW